jgi:hypothetical protein
MKNRTREIVETDCGSGKLFCADAYIGEVDYRYKIAQEYISVKTQKGTKVVPGLINLRGSFATNSTLDLLGKDLRLITAKGKELLITIMAGDPVVKVYIFIFSQSAQ